MKELSILSPIKITTQHRFEIFVRCLNSYKSLLQNENIEVLVVNESSGSFKSAVNKVISSITKKTLFLEGVGMVNSVRELIRKSNSKYIMFLLDDVELLFEPNTCIIDCVSVMENDITIDQIKFGGGKVYSSNKKQVDIFKNNHKPIKINNNFIWLNDSNKEDPMYLISQWNAITRTDTLKRLNNKFNINSIKSWDGFSVECSKIYKNENRETKTGWLNLECGLYAWGRTSESFEKYKLNYDKNNRR